MEDPSSLGKAGVLNMNQLSYRMPPDLSVAVSRTVTTQHFANQSAAPGSSSTAIWNTGASYINAKETLLIFDLKNTSSVKQWFGLHGGSAANLINRLVISSRSGQVLEKIDRCNQLCTINALYRHDKDWASSTGSLFGMVPTITDLDWGSGETIRVCIPLSFLSPMMSSIESLLPSQLCSGLRFEVTWETSATALVSGADADVLGYSVSNMRFATEAYLLSDLVMRSLNSQAAEAGLEIVCTTAHNNMTSRATSLLTTDVGKSVSRALSFCYKERAIVASVGTSTTSKFRSIKQDAASYVTEFQARVGSMYYPQSSIRTDASMMARGSCPELMSTSLRCYNKLNPQDRIACQVTDKTFRDGDMAICQDLERSNVQRLSGIPLSQSRTLSITASYQETTTSQTDVDIFLYFVELIRCFSSQCVIEI